MTSLEASKVDVLKLSSYAPPKTRATEWRVEIFLRSNYGALFVAFVSSSNERDYRCLQVDRLYLRRRRPKA